MIVLKVFPLFILLAASYCTKDFQNIYVKGVRCNSSEKYVHNLTCYAKSYNRSFSAVNIIGFTKRPLYKIFLNVDVFFKYGVIYREVLHCPKFDLCKVVDEDNFSNKLIATTLQFLNDTVPGIIHKCPYSFLNVTNARPSTNALTSIFPAGDYKYVIHIRDDKDEFIGTLNTIFTMISSERNTFG